MKIKHRMSLLAGILLVLSSQFTMANKKEVDKRGKPVVQHFMVRIGLQYGIGLPFNSRYKNDLNTPLLFSHNVNAFLKLRCKHLSISGGIRNSSFTIEKDELQKSIETSYNKPNFTISSNTKGSSADIVTPYIGFGYAIKYKRFEFEPFLQLGIGVLNNVLSEVTLSSNNSSVLDQRVTFVDNQAQTFFYPSVGLNVHRRLFNALTITGNIAFNTGNPGRSELQEVTKQGQSTTIRKRNIYVENGITNFCIMFGVEFTPFRRLFPNEKNYEKLKKKLEHSKGS